MRRELTMKYDNLTNVLILRDSLADEGDTKGANRAGALAEHLWTRTAPKQRHKTAADNRTVGEAEAVAADADLDSTYGDHHEAARGGGGDNPFEGL